jgi:hypothetical protein
MATGNYIQDKGYNAAVAITKFRAVKFSAAETVTPVTADTDAVAGIAQVGVTAGEILRGKGVQVRRMGASELEASAAIPIQSEVAITADGRGIVAVAGDRVIGICDEAALNAAERIRVTLSLPGYIKA